MTAFIKLFIFPFLLVLEQFVAIVIVIVLIIQMAGLSSRHSVPDSTATAVAGACLLLSLFDKVLSNQYTITIQ